MDQHFTPDEAWLDFWAWIKQQPKWAEIPRSEKQALYKAKKGAGFRRIRRILEQYAPGRYDFREAVILNKK